MGHTQGAAKERGKEATVKGRRGPGVCASRCFLSDLGAATDLHRHSASTPLSLSIHKASVQHLEVILAKKVFKNSRDFLRAWGSYMPRAMATFSLFLESLNLA
jgi:hypothetical protein